MIRLGSETRSGRSSQSSFVRTESSTLRAGSSPDELDVTIGSLDEPQRVAPRDHTWVGDRLPWIHLTDGLPVFPTARPAASDQEYLD